MLGLIVILLAIALPLGIAFFTVMATGSERTNYKHTPVSKFISALVFGVSALLGLALVFRGTGAEYASAVALIMGMPTTIIAALLAASSHRILVGSSKFLAALFGAGIAFSTVVGTSLLFGGLFAPDPSAALFMAVFGAVIVLLPAGLPVLLLGACAGFLLSYLSNRKRSNF